MPGIDEDILRELMHRGTDDLHASPHITVGIVRRQRRRRLRNRALSVAATGAAAGTVFAVVASASGGAPRPETSPPSTTPALRLTASQRVLYKLSSAAAGTARPEGRYVVMAEKQDNYARTSVLDSVTGVVWTYQRGAGVPSELPVARHDSPTAAQFDAMPTDTVALRALLLKQAREQQAQAIAWQQKELKAHGKKGAVIHQPRLTDDDFVFEQATTLLWNPLVGPELRSALYKVLAATPGVRVDSHARDDLGRPAVEISRTATATGIEDQTFENPKTGAALETAFVYQDGTKGTDLYLSVTSRNTVPPNPYRH